MNICVCVCCRFDGKKIDTRTQKEAVEVSLMRKKNLENLTLTGNIEANCEEGGIGPPT